MSPDRFAAFAPPLRSASTLRRAITASARLPERACVPPLAAAASVPADLAAPIADTARKLVEGLRAAPSRGGVQALVHEYALSSQEGVALMCLAEALLRIPDAATRDALIRDKIAGGDWGAHLGDGRSLFVNAATWGLVVTGKLTSSVDDTGLAAALTRVVARLGEPVIRRGVDMAMRMMGEQFVTGQTIAEALENAAEREQRGFGFSYDMLGEAATTAADAARYYRDYEQAIHAIGKAAARRGPYAGPGISIKLSALHPRYVRAQQARVMAELLPRVAALAQLAHGYDIGFNIDAEEADRLELSLDLLEALATDPRLAGWQGLGFVVQAYGKRCPLVIDFIIDLARRSNRRIMVRLVKGAYWDAEIKRAQVDGLADFPVYTRKVYTDVAYIACARKLLAARDSVFPQFATHNAQTLATILHLAEPGFQPGDYEFQCLHGMGEPLYDQVVGAGGLNRPCRVYAPVGTHETLLAYLVRRLLENGANSSFVHRIGDADVPVDDLIADPAAQVLAMADPGAPHPAIALPRDLYRPRRNSAGLDLADEAALAALSQALVQSAAIDWQAGDWQAGNESTDKASRSVCNPADRRDTVGFVTETAPGDVARVMAHAKVAGPAWAATPVHHRAACLEHAATLMQQRMPLLVGLLIREAGKSAANAVSEVREAIDFLRYYAAEARTTLAASVPLGPVVCISPWNFPLAIFTGQVAAALVAGNSVLAKPSGETPLVAAQAARLLHAAGISTGVLQLVPGGGDVGDALVCAPETAGVVFTGSTEVARTIQSRLAGRVSGSGAPIPLIAETGGQNAMIVDSSALAEQVVADVIASAFDSAGQRCSALRILCLQEDIADRTLAMLKGALAELSVGPTDRLSNDVGPVISDRARAGIEAHIAKMRAAGYAVTQAPLPPETAHGTFVAPAIIEIDAIGALGREVFGPVLHVMRYARAELDTLIDAINATGYGLTFGLHTRLDATIAHVTARIGAGNCYINRNVIGAVVGVQPFGGRGLSGTGPKAGGPLYLRRLVARATVSQSSPHKRDTPSLAALIDWLRDRGMDSCAQTVAGYGARSRLGLDIDLPGPVGERNRYALHPRGHIGIVASHEDDLCHAIGAVLATGNTAVVLSPSPRLDGLPATLAARVAWAAQGLEDVPGLAAVLAAPGHVDEATRACASRGGAIVSVHAIPTDRDRMPLDMLVEEVSTSINTTAAGGNASLMAMT